SGRLGFRGQAFKYAYREIFSRKQALVRVLVATLLLAASCAFTFLSDLGKGSVRYLRDTTLNKPDEYINRFTAQRQLAETRLTPEQVAFLASNVPGLKAPPTFIQKAFKYDVYDKYGKHDTRYDGPFSVPDGDDMLRPVAPEDRDRAQIGVIYLR